MRAREGAERRGTGRAGVAAVPPTGESAEVAAARFTLSLLAALAATAPAFANVLADRVTLTAAALRFLVTFAVAWAASRLLVALFSPRAAVLAPVVADEAGETAGGE